jgi:DNA-binding MarR family transcriptional regulator
VPSTIPPGAPVHAQAAYLLARIGRRQSLAFAEHLAPLGLRPRHFAMLNVIAMSEGISQQELGARLGLDPSGLVGGIDELESLGLAERRRDAADRRRYALRLTEEGAATLARARRRVSDGSQKLLAPLDEDEVATLVGLLRRLAAD